MVARRSPSVSRVAAVLDHLAAYPEDTFGLSTLCRALDLNKATAHALLAELVACGYVVRDPVEKTYSLGPKLLSIGLAANRHDRIAVDRCRPHLRRLATQFDARCVLTTVRGDEIVVLEAFGRDQPFAPSLLPGHRIPFDPPLGTAFLVRAREEEVEWWLQRGGDLDAAERQGLLDAIDAVRRRGCSLSLDVDSRARLHQAVVAEGERPVTELVHELSRQGYLLTDLDPRRTYRLSVLVAPVFHAGDGVALGLTIYGLAGTRTAAQVGEVVQHLCDAAAAVTEAIGGRPLVPEPPKKRAATKRAIPKRAARPRR